ncbi:MAG: hypothetical protein KDA80_10800 [Planctomycetaceae bacterium]|nr:hypothetical protein [Planctomycetaceae bacterium]
MPESNHTFQGIDGTTYTVSVNPVSLLNVENLCGVKLLDITTSDLASRLADDPVLMATVAYVLCCMDKNPGEFGANVSDPDVFTAMTEAVLRAVVDYLPENQRKHFAELVA